MTWWIHTHRTSTVASFQTVFVILREFRSVRNKTSSKRLNHKFMIPTFGQAPHVPASPEPLVLSWMLQGLFVTSVRRGNHCKIRFLFQKPQLILDNATYV